MAENYQGNFPEKAMFGHCYVMNQKMTRLYDSEEGLKKGTIFPELFSPYSPGDSLREIEYLKNYYRTGGNNR